MYSVLFLRRLVGNSPLLGESRSYSGFPHRFKISNFISTALGAIFCWRQVNTIIFQDLSRAGLVRPWRSVCPCVISDAVDGVSFQANSVSNCAENSIPRTVHSHSAGQCSTFTLSSIGSNDVLLVVMMSSLLSGSISMRAII